MIAVLAVLLAGVLVTPVSRVVAQSQPPRTGLGIGLLEAPASRRDDPRASVYIVDHVAPGTDFSRRIQVANDTGRAVGVELYPVTATIEDGAFRVDPGRGTAEATSWITISPQTLQLTDGERREATVAVSVPANAKAGEHYGAVMAEIPPPDAGPGQVAVSSRVGIRFYLSVGGGEEPETDFELPAFRPIRQRDGRPAIEIDGCNTGGRAVDLTGEVELAEGPGGIKAGPFPTPNATTLAPEQCHTFTIPMDKELPNGPWDATAKLRSGEEERTAEARITFPKDAGERGKKVETKQVTGTVPGIIALGVSVVLLLLLAGWLLWFLLKRRARRKDDEEEERQ